MQGPLHKSRCGLLLFDVQEKLYPFMWQKERFLKHVILLLQVWKKERLPLLVAQQNPENLGTTLPELRHYLPEDHSVFSKMTFFGDE